MEMGSRNHVIVPTSLINSLSKLGPCAKILLGLTRQKLIARENSAKCIYCNVEQFRFKFISSMRREARLNL